MNNLIQLEKVVGADVKKLRCLYDKIEANVRALNSVGIESEHFGALLILNTDSSAKITERH